jgi:hypothetical protein
MDELLFVESASIGKTRLVDWMVQNRQRLGRHYAHEINRRTNRIKSYKELSR